MSVKNFAECDMCGEIMVANGSWQQIAGRQDFALIQGGTCFDSYIVFDKTQIGRKVTVKIRCDGHGHLCPACLLKVLKKFEVKLKKGMKSGIVKFAG